MRRSTSGMGRPVLARITACSSKGSARSAFSSWEIVSTGQVSDRP